MADLIDIELGDQRIRVPAWATEATLEAVMKYNEITARALNKLVGVGTDGKKTSRVQEHYFKQIVEELQKSKKKQEELVNQNNQLIKAEKTKSSATTARVKTQNSDKSSTDFDKKISDLSKSYSTSVSLVEGSLLYLSKSLIDLNLVLRDVSKTFKSITEKTGATGSSAAGGGSSNNSSRTSNIRTKPYDPRTKERRDPSFMSEYTKLVEDLENGIKPTEKLVKNIEKALQFTKIKDLDKKDIADLKSAIQKLSAGSMPDSDTIDRMSDALDNYSKYDKSNIKIMEELKSYYLKYLNDDMTLSERNREISRDIIRSQERTTRAMKDFTSSFTDASLKGMATAIGSVIGLGAAAGFTAGVIENFAKNISIMADVSIGFGQQLDALKIQASLTGMSLDSYSKFVSENSVAIKSLGNSTQDGANKFSILSEELQKQAQEFNHFGLSNTEYNEILAQEIEMRRKSGMDSFQINNLVNDSMTELLYQTTMLSSLTGKSAREMRRTMQEAMNDSLFANSMGNLSQVSKEAAVNLETAVKQLGTSSPAMLEITKSMINSIDTGINYRLGLSDNARTAVSILGPEMESLFTSISNNFSNMSKEEFTALLAEQAGNISTAIENNPILAMQAQAGLGGAKELLDIKSGLSGMNKDFNEAIKIQEETATALKNSPGLNLSSNLETTVATATAAATTEAFKLLNIDPNNSIKGLNEFLVNINNNIKDNGLLGGLSETFSQLDTTTQLLLGSFAALSAAAVAFPTILATVVGTSSLLSSIIAPGAMSTTGTQAAARMMGLGGAGASGAGASGAVKGGSKILRGLGRLAVPLTIGMGAYDAYSALSDDTLTTRQKSEGVGEAVGGTGGALAGAAAGAAIGSIVPIIGTTIGGIAGGLLGYFGGSALGGAAGGAIGSTISDDIASTTAAVDVNSSYLNTIAVASNTTNVWLQTLTGFSENIRDDISQIKANGGIKDDKNLTDLLSASAQNSEFMLVKMQETNSLLLRLIRKYDEASNN